MIDSLAKSYRTASVDLGTWLRLMFLSTLSGMLVGFDPERFDDVVVSH